MCWCARRVSFFHVTLYACRPLYKCHSQTMIYIGFTFQQLVWSMETASVDFMTFLTPPLLAPLSFQCLPTIKKECHVVLLRPRIFWIFICVHCCFVSGQTLTNVKNIPVKYYYIVSVGWKRNMYKAVTFQGSSSKRATCLSGQLHRVSYRS